jgi:hypothetical protein
MSKNNPYDDDDFRAFVSNESRIKTDDREIDEHSPENLLPDELDTDCMGNCFSDADPGL